MNRNPFSRLFLLLGCVVAVTLSALAPAQAAEPPEKIDPAVGCVTAECHSDITSRAFLHGPVNLKQCQPCHTPQGDRHQFEPMPTGKDLCLRCHATETMQDVVHPPFASDCMMCHDPHGLDNRSFVIGGTGAEGCQRCHTDVRQGLEFAHGPVALGECLACHSPHQSEFKGLLIEKGTNLCMGCHVDMAQELEGAVSVHQPVKDNCSGCHHAHGGNTQYFLTQDPRELCRSCHGEFLQKVETYKYTHAPMIEGKACQNCHSPHTSNQEHLLSQKTMDLCLECHNKKIETGTRVLHNIGAEIESSKYLHGPLREGNCVACHAAHGSDFWDILDKEFPRDFYAPYKEGAYDLCFECHDRQIVQDEESSVTNFRNGLRNLHYVHVNREKGRTCRACHNEHASNQPKHIREEVPFGRWTMKVEYVKTDTGGGCTTGCHLPYKYDRVDPVENVKAPVAGEAASAPAPAPASGTEAEQP